MLYIVCLQAYLMFAIIVSFIPSPSSSCPLLLTLRLFHPSSASRFSLLQLLNSLSLLLARLPRHSLTPSLHYQFMQPAKARIEILGLFPRIVCLDHKIRSLGSMIS